MNLYVGCPIWAYKGWVGSFYPPGTKAADYLQEYSRRLTTIEGNTTFYSVPSPKTLQDWVAETPETFHFCPKLPRTISHTGKLAEHTTEAIHFVEVMSQLGERLGPMFLQLPPRYSPLLLDDLQAFLNSWPPQVKLAVEVRHIDWFSSPHHEALNTMLSGYDMARVVIDTRPIRNLEGDKILTGSVYQRLLQARQRKPHLPILSQPTASFFFLRYIGHPELEQNIAYLDEWAAHLASWLREGIEAYGFCHCPDERLDPWLCRQLHQRVAKQIPLSPLLWDETDASSIRQTRLF